MNRSIGRCGEVLLLLEEIGGVQLLLEAVGGVNLDVGRPLQRWIIIIKLKTFNLKNVNDLLQIFITSEKEG